MNLIQTEFDPRAAAIADLHAATAIYTASPVVHALLKRIDWPKRPGRLLDPGAGDGSFLLGALSLMDLTPDDPLAVARVAGIEIHPEAVRQGRERIAAFLAGQGWKPEAAVRAATAMLVEGDFLAEPPSPGEFAMIAGNPPYLRVTNLPKYFQELYSSLVPEFAQGDILHAFLARCAEILPDDGLVAVVTSDRWMTNLSTGHLRAHLGARFAITHLARLDVTTAFYRPKSRKKGTPPRIHPIEVVLEAGIEAGRRLTAEVVSLDGEDRVEGPTLAHIANIRIAPWLGPEGVFVVEKEVGARLTGVTLIPAVDVDDISREADVLTGIHRYALKVEGEGPPTGTVRAHLEKQFYRMPQRCQKRGVFWVPPEPINIPLTGGRLLIPRIARCLRAVPLPEGVLGLNHNLQVASPADDISIGLLREIITCEESQAWIRSNAPRLEGGFFSITTMLLRRMPIPERSGRNWKRRPERLRTLSFPVSP